MVCPDGWNVVPTYQGINISVFSYIKTPTSINADKPRLFEMNNFVWLELKRPIDITPRRSEYVVLRTV